MFEYKSNVTFFNRIIFCIRKKIFKVYFYFIYISIKTICAFVKSCSMKADQKKSYESGSDMMTIDNKK